MPRTPITGNSPTLMCWRSEATAGIYKVWIEMVIPKPFLNNGCIHHRISNKNTQCCACRFGLKFITYGVMKHTGPTHHVLCRTCTDGNTGIASQQPEAYTLGTAQMWWLQICREQKFLFDLLSFILLLCSTFGICCTYLGLGGSVRVH